MKTKIWMGAMIIMANVAWAVTAAPALAQKWVPAVVANYPVSGTATWTGTGAGKSHTGTLQLKSGTVQMQGEQVISGVFVMDMTSLQNENKKLEGHLKSPDFFDVAKFPEARFVLKSATADPRAGANGYTVSGVLTIRDKSDTLNFPATIMQTDRGIAAKGTLTIADRTRFDIKYNSKKFFDMAALKDKVIDDQISISLDVHGSKMP
jgi:polyisoprenoid-binding protein YceI